MYTILSIASLLKPPNPPACIEYTWFGGLNLFP